MMNKKEESLTYYKAKYTLRIYFGNYFAGQLEGLVRCAGSTLNTLHNLCETHEGMHDGEAYCEVHADKNNPFHHSS